MLQSRERRVRTRPRTDKIFMPFCTIFWVLDSSGFSRSFESSCVNRARARDFGSDFDFNRVGLRNSIDRRTRARIISRRDHSLAPRRPARTVLRVSRFYAFHG